MPRPVLGALLGLWEGKELNLKELKEFETLFVDTIDVSDLARF
jgi:hypothetical protein